LPSKHTKIIPVASAIGLRHKNLYKKLFENMSVFQIWFTSVQDKLATLHATIGLVITWCYRIKRIKIKGFILSQ